MKKKQTKPAKQQHIYASIRAASGALGVPESVVRQAKAKGASGFDAGGRVDVHRLAAWLLTKGKDFSPQRSLEQARAKLAEARAEQIERDAALAEGRVLPVFWLSAEIENAFRDAGTWLNNPERQQWLVAVSAPGNGPMDVAVIRDNLQKALAQDCKTLKIELGHIRQRIRRILETGPNEDTAAENSIALAKQWLATLAKQLSPAARDEVVASIGVDTLDPFPSKTPEPQQ